MGHRESQEVNMYLTKKDRKIQMQQKIIDRLEEENECLKEQMEQYDPKHMIEQIDLIRQAHGEYVGLTEELNGLREEYQELLRQMRKDKVKLKKNCR